jgi:rhodanese-related sulfurtransferase
MRKHNLLYLLVAALLVFAVGCSDDDPVAPTPTPVNESQVLAEYLEANGDYINSAGCPSIVAASAVYQDINANPPTQYIVDLRSATDFAAGHIQGAHNVALADLLTHLRGLNLASYNRVVIVCYTGQTSAYGTSLMRLMGYSTVTSMKFGMCSWDSTFATTRWLANIGNSRASQFTTSPTVKAAAGNLPTLSTGKTTGPEILAVRVDTLLRRGYTEATVSHTTVFNGLANYYISNYWSAAEYADPGHIPGAIQYTPRSDFKLTTYLKTLPTDKPVVVYCYTGQTSSFMAAYLRLLGYDAKSLLYGGNGMIYDMMLARNMTTFKRSDIMGYPYVTGSR